MPRKSEPIQGRPCRDRLAALPWDATPAQRAQPDLDGRDDRSEDCALASLARQPFGTILLGGVAVGLLAYGAFSLIEGRYRRLGP